MEKRDWNTAGNQAIIYGTIIAAVLILFYIPPGFALAVGVISGIVAFFVLNEPDEKSHSGT